MKDKISTLKTDEIRTFNETLVIYGHWSIIEYRPHYFSNLNKNNMQKIVPFIWYDEKAKEAAELYTSLFEDSEITNVTNLTNTPSGEVDIVSFKLAGQHFQSISSGPGFKPNPAISFMVSCDTSEEVDKIWNGLIEGATVLMPLNTYPFSKHYGWLSDKYGVSWQIMQVDEMKTDKITPSMLFVGDVCGQAEEAMKFYVSVFDGKLPENEQLAYYTKEDSPEAEGMIKYARFSLSGQEFVVMDSNLAHNFSFNEAISFMVNCDTQEEIDYYWEKLSAVPEAEQCGWLKDKYGVSWQIVPTELDEMMVGGTKEQISNITKAFLPMKKFDIATLKEAYNSN